MNAPPFLFATCQIGAEAALKAELARKWPAFRFAFSRPGFLTFKLPPGAPLADDFDLRSVFARSYGFSLGKAGGAAPAERAASVWQLAGPRAFDALHVWQRDLHEPGFRGYEPGLTELAAEAEQALRHAAPGRLPADEAAATGSHHFIPANSARPGQLVLDCVIVEPDQWWAGYHRAGALPSRWPGGMFPLPVPENAVSRAHLKMDEALAWSRMPVRAGDVWAEIGSAPGGASQALLGRGLVVMGIDPADMDPAVLAHPNFKHYKMRGADVRRKEFRRVQYLAADINVAPQYTLDTVEHIVTHPEVKIRGLILTLKLLQWSLADEVPAYLDRIRAWGFGNVRARQLHHNRREICVAARTEAR